MRRTIQGYGWIPDLPDARDLRYSAPPSVLVALPLRVDLREQCPAVYDQGDLGSCTANAIAAVHEFDQMKQQQARVFTPSRLFIYYNERVIEGTIKIDSGAMLRDGIKSIANLGAAPEASWPYVITKFANRPPKKCYEKAAAHQALRYQRLTPTLTQLKGCLASGYPFVFGFTVYEGFQSEAVAQTGEVAMPSGLYERVVGGHAVTAVGYDDPSQRFIVRNSWGTQWGLKGYCTFPYAYLLDRHLADDFWTVRLVE